MPPSAVVDVAAFEAGISALELEYDARVGISAVDTGDNGLLEFRSDERFGYASTVKALAAAMFLRDTPPDQREQRVYWDAADIELAGYSPMTSARIADGATLAELAEASVRTSDNTALNMVLEHLGGPAALTTKLRTIGDNTTQAVNIEEELNWLTPGSDADTTSPAAFAQNLVAIVNGEVLTEQDRTTLLDWMSGNATGDTLIRAGAPDGWVVADKSGGAGAIRNDIAIVTPPAQEPIILTVLTTRNDPAVDYDNTLVSRAAEIALDSITGDGL
ncbi:MAG: class A beta-lactamase [Rhodococcus sp. (in: high G+C Gram-positive bacteria)]